MKLEDFNGASGNASGRNAKTPSALGRGAGVTGIGRGEVFNVADARSALS